MFGTKKDHIEQGNSDLEIKKNVLFNVRFLAASLHM